jgi:hypothetical protein
MGAPTSEVGYTSATTGRGDHEVHKGHAVALEKITVFCIVCTVFLYCFVYVYLFLFVLSVLV